MDWKALAFFTKLKLLEIARHGSNIICVSLKVGQENLEGLSLEKLVISYDIYFRTSSFANPSPNTKDTIINDKRVFRL